MSYGVDVANIYEILAGGDVAKKAAPAEREDAKAPARKQNEKGGRGGRGRGRGGRSGDGKGRPPKFRAEGNATRKRQYDRKSGTGRSSDMKKGGGGKGNWGKTSDVDEDLVSASSAEVPNGESVIDSASEEPEVPTLTLEEYRKQQAQKKVDIAKPKPRQANEGHENEEWKKFQQLNRDEEDDSGFLGMTAKRSDSNGPNKKSNKKGVVAVDQVFRVKEKPTRGGRGGKRGSERGTRGDSGRAEKSDKKNGNKKSISIDTSDESAFPALGK